MEDKDNLPIIIGVVAALLAGIFLYADRHHGAAAPGSGPVVTTPASAPPPAQSDQLALPSSVIQQQPQTQTIYECVKDGKRMFSDVPCGDNARLRTLSPTNVMDAPQPVYPSPPNSYATNTRNATADQTEAAPRDCSTYEEAVKNIDARMRQGYTSWEGESLRSQRRHAAAERDDCRRDNRLR